MIESDEEQGRDLARLVVSRAGRLVTTLDDGGEHVGKLGADDEEPFGVGLGGSDLPVGLDYDDDGQVMLTPDEAVRSAIGQVHALFGQLGSARQVMMTLRGRGLPLPRRKAGARRVSWAEASYPAVHDMLTNPAYAGAFVFGRTRAEKHVDAAGKVVTRERLLPQDQWEVLIPGHHPGYLGWDAYQDNQARLRANYRAPRGDGGGAAQGPPAGARRCCRAWCAAASAAG